jgi:spore germination protein YaaH
MTTYKCKACGCWHLGQPTPKPKKRMPYVRKNNHDFRHL